MTKRPCRNHIPAFTAKVAFAAALAIGVVAIVVLFPHVARAQMFQCPAGSVPVSGGGGMMCQCPDGSFAAIWGCKTAYQPQYVSRPPVSAPTNPNAAPMSKRQAERLARERILAEQARRAKEERLRADANRTAEIQRRKDALRLARQRDEQAAPMRRQADPNNPVLTEKVSTRLLNALGTPANNSNAQPLANPAQQSISQIDATTLASGQAAAPAASYTGAQPAGAANAGGPQAGAIQWGSAPPAGVVAPGNGQPIGFIRQPDGRLDPIYSSPPCATTGQTGPTSYECASYGDPGAPSQTSVSSQLLSALRPQSDSANLASLTTKSEQSASATTTQAAGSLAGSGAITDAFDQANSPRSEQLPSQSTNTTVGQRPTMAGAMRQLYSNDELLAMMNDPRLSAAERKDAAVALGKNPNSIVLQSSGTRQSQSQAPAPGNAGGGLALNPGLKEVAGLSPPTAAPRQSAVTSGALILPEPPRAVSTFAPPRITTAYALDKKELKQDFAYALMSRDAYENPNTSSFAPPGYQRADMNWWDYFKQAGVSQADINKIERSGFSATLYRRADSKEIVIAFRGTEFNLSRDAARDAASDVGARFVPPSAGVYSIQFDAAAKLTELAKKQGAPVVLTGHSLGGALASYAGSATNSQVVTFNGARNLYSAASDNPNQTNFVVQGDIVGDQYAGAAAKAFGTGSLPGRTLEVPSTSGNGAHGIDGIVGGLRDLAR